MTVGALDLPLVIRRAGPADRDRVIRLCRAALGWRPEDPDEAFFRWKHDENPFGPSPTWVAEAPGGELVGLRVFLRWRFRRPDGAVVRAVRAVDTATHPAHQGRGIFTRLTLDALPELRAEGVDVIFNTPNDKSRPGYLKMGWGVVGRVPVGVRFRSPASLARLWGARAPAERWSEPGPVGMAAADFFADESTAAEVLAAAAPARALATDRDPAYLGWRYRFAPLEYRVLTIGSRPRDGVVVFRVRTRGAAREAAICEVVAPSGSRVRSAVGEILRGTGADYALAGAGVGPIDGFLPAPGVGPVLTWKPLARPGVPRPADLDLVLGDVELF